MASISQGGRTYDTNNQSDRADLRKAGYYIDNSGVYAPGQGQRVGDTWSGSNAGNNTPDDGHRLPVIGGRPVSPSNGFTGPNTGYIMYRGDPMYQRFFGMGTPGFSSAPTPWAPGGKWDGQDPNGYLSSAPLTDPSIQTPFLDYLKQQGLSTTGLTDPTGTTPAGGRDNGPLATDGQSFGSQDPQTQAMFQSVWGPNAAQQWTNQHNNALQMPNPFAQSGLPEGRGR